jgi:hypothetical protein
MNPTACIRHQGVHCDLQIEALAPGVVRIKLSGWDAGEFGDLPMQQLGTHLDVLGGELLELYIDARAVRGASIDVSSDWARWLGRHKQHFAHISMLTGSSFIQLTAKFVQRFAELGELMRIYTEARAFDSALADSVQQQSQKRREKDSEPKRSG